MRVIRVIAILLLTFAVHAAVPGEETVPPRDLARSLAGLPDGELWAAIERSGRRATVGLRRPGQSRGIWKQKVLLDRTELLGFRKPLSDLGVTVGKFDSVLPAVTVELADAEQLARLRRSPFVDYVEPAGSALSLSSTGGIGGCTDGWWADLRKPPLETIDTGDYVPWNYRRHKIQDAWLRGATGAGINVAWVDVGLFRDQLQLVGDPGRGGQYAQGMSTERSIQHHFTHGLDPYNANCSHGTRIGATAVAPRDGKSIVGIAYKANGISVKSMDGVVIGNDALIHNHETVAAGIRMAAELGANVINMAFGSTYEIQLVADEIRRQYYARPRLLFVAASGTTAYPGPAVGMVVFPARMGPEVIGVGGSNYENVYEPHSSTFYGPEVDVTAVLDWHQPAPGRTPEDIIDFGGTSAASSMISGMIAQIWSKYPSWNRDQVQARLFESGFSTRRSDVGFGPPDIYKAVGGFQSVTITGPERVLPSKTYKLTAVPTGDGPFRYEWDSGETTPSISRRSSCAGSPSALHMVTVTDLVDGKQRTEARTVEFQCSWQ